MLSWIRSETSLRGLTVAFLDEAMDRLAVAEAVILQAALAGLVADRAVERMIEQQILHDHPLVLLDLGAVGHQHGPVLGRRLAAGDQLGKQLDLAGLGVLGADLDLAHPAVGDHRERGVPAVVGDVDPDSLGHLDGVELLALGDRVFAAIDDDGRHGLAISVRFKCRFGAELRRCIVQPGPVRAMQRGRTGARRADRQQVGVGAMPWAIALLERRDSPRRRLVASGCTLRARRGTWRRRS